MTRKPDQFAGGALPVVEHAQAGPGMTTHARPLVSRTPLELFGVAPSTLRLLFHPGAPQLELADMPPCDTVAPRGQRVIGQKGASMARRRYQAGCLFVRGKRRKVWVAQWREDVIQSNGSVHRVLKKQVLGTLTELPTRKLARRRLDLLLVHVNSPSYRPGKSASFAEFVELWRERVLRLQKPSTARTAHSHLHRHLLPRFGTAKLETIGQEQIQAFVSDLSRKLSRHTVTNILSMLGSILNTARRWGYVVGEVKLSELSFPSVSVGKRGRYFTAEQTRQIIAAAEEPWRTLFTIAAMTGLRAGELLGLQVEDLDFSQHVIHVRRSAWYGKVQAPKSKASIRTVPMPQALARVLLDYLKQWQPNPGRFLFVTRNNRPPSSNKVVQYQLWPILDKLGIPRCGLHAFRHTAASLLVAEGAPATVAQAQLGHTDAKVTLGIYSHVIDAQHRQYAERVADLLMPDDAKHEVATKLIQ